MKNLYPFLKRTCFCILFAILFLFLSHEGNAQKYTAGTYTVGADGGNYFQTISEAIDSLELYGISGHIVLSLIDAEYYERVGINVIPGTAPDSTVTIQSASQNPDDCRIYSDQTNGTSINWVVEFQGCDYVTIQHVTIQNTTLNSSYTRVISFWENPSNIKLLHNRIIGEGGGPTGSNEHVIYSYNITITNTEISYNEIIGGNYPVWIHNSSTSYISTGVKFNYNTCNSNGNASFEYCYGIEVIGNEINSPRYSGLAFTECDNEIIVNENIIQATYTSAHAGLYFNNCNSLTNQESMIVNNIVYVAGGSTDNYGIQILNSSYQKIYHNTVWLYQSSIKGAALHLSNNNDLEVANNIFACSNNALTFYANDADNTILCNYNNFYSRGNYIAHYNGSLYHDLAEFQTATGFDDSGSKSVYPRFYSRPDSLTPTTPWLEDCGLNIFTDVGTDINGVARSTAPCLGAYEFSATNPGTYSGALTIKPGGGGTFLSFGEAVDSLVKNGIGGSVTITADPGNYEEQIYIRAIPGASALNTITFQGDESDSTLVELTYTTNSSSNYVVYWQNADYITFKKMTVTSTGDTHGRVFSMNGHAHHNTIENCLLNGAGPAGNNDDRVIIYAYQDLPDNLTIQNNVIQNGSRGITLLGVESNFKDQAERISNVTIKDNVFSSHETDISFTRGDNFEISGNTFTDFSTQGIYLYYCQSPYFVNNNIFNSTVLSSSTSYAMNIYLCAGSSAGGLIYNNFIYVGSSSDARNIYGIHLYRSNYQSIYHNSIHVTSADVDSRCIDYQYYSDNAESQNNKLVNNNLYISNQGWPIVNAYANAFSQCDFNNYFTYSNTFASWGGTNYSDLEAFISGSSSNTNSVSYNPLYFSESDLHTNNYWLDGAGFALGDVTDDIDGDLREDPPDIGADEFTDVLPPLSGEYLIGAGQSIISLSAAVDSLIARGIDGNVTFNILSETYTEQFEIPQISGAADNAQILFQAATKNAADVIVEYGPAGSGDNYIAYLNGADYITFRNITFESLGTDYARILRLNGTCLNVTVDSCIFNGVGVGADQTSRACISNTNDQLTNITITHNVFNNGDRGIYLTGVSDAITTSGADISFNIFNGERTGVYLQYHTNFNIYNNEFYDFNYIGIYLNSCPNTYSVYNNKLSSTEVIGETYIGSYGDGNNAAGIKTKYCYATGQQALIYNNFIHLEGDNIIFGIYHSRNKNQNYYNNSINVKNTNDESAAFYHQINSTTDEKGMIMKNNICMMDGAGNAFRSWWATDQNIQMDYNDFYTTGDNLIRWRVGTSDTRYYNTVEDFFSATGNGEHSMDTIPLFVSESDLHLKNEVFMGKGVDLNNVTTDIDGDDRSDPPDMGADEITCEAVTLTVYDTVACQNQAFDVRFEAPGINEETVFLYWDLDNNGVNEDTTRFGSPVSATYTTSGPKTAKLTLYQLGGCTVSETFSVNVQSTPAAPIINDTIGCSGVYTPNLAVTGDSIRWYSDEGLTTLIYSGGTFDPEVSAVGIYNYYVTETDGNCQSFAADVTLTIYDAPDSPITTSNLEYCFGDSIANLTATGNNIKWYSDSTLNNLLLSSNTYNPAITAAGNYYFYVTQSDENCFSNPAEVNLLVNPTATIEGITTDIDCGPNPFGTINISVDDGTEPYFFDWSNGASSEDVTRLEAGRYYITVEDLNNCSVADSFDILAPPEIILTMITNDADCGEPNGDATVSVEGGEAPFEFRWNTGDSVASIDELNSGLYFVTVTDNNGCAESGVAAINDLGGPTIDVTSVSDITCYGLNDGAINVDITGGVTPYDILWSNGATTASISELVAGPYELVVADADGCKSVETVTVNQPAPIFIDLDVFDANCGQNNGSATATVTGGTEPYAFIWQDGASFTDELVNLGLGVYHVEVTDDNDCRAIKSFAISEIGAPTIAVDSVFEGTCGNEDGAIYISVYGAYLDYAYMWSNDSTSQDLIGVNPGIYSVTVTDSANCASAEVVDLAPVKPESIPICIVSVDTTTNYNEIVWEKPETDNITQFNIYKESTQSGVYQLIGEWPYDSLSIFVDTNSNARQRSSRYKLSVVDVCGIESELSDHHKTMHLTLGLGLGNTVNLRWDHYEGFPIETYYIYRYTTSTGWVKYDSIQSNLTSYTDFNPPFNDNLYYFIEIVNPNGCIATKATNRNNSRSNVGSITSGGATAYNVLFVIDDGTDPISGAAISFDSENTFSDENGESLYENKAPGSYDYTVTAFGYNAATGTVIVEEEDVTENVTLTVVSVASIEEMRNILIYPNPNTGAFFINTEIYEETDLLINIYNLQGQIIKSIKEQNAHGKWNKEIKLESQFAGIYYVQIITEHNNVVRKIIVE